MQEIELKFLNVDVKSIREKISNIGAILKYETMIESTLFIADGFDGWNSSKKFLRVRKVDDKVQITYKGPEEESRMTSREEIEINADSYEDSIKLISKLGFTKEDTYRKQRIHYELGDISFELDTLDNIPTYLEIETNTEKSMIEVCKSLELDIKKGKKGTIVEILPERFNK